MIACRRAHEQPHVTTLNTREEGPRCELMESIVEALSQIDTFLMGRVTYQGTAGHWPTATDEIGPPFASPIVAVFMHRFFTFWLALVPGVVVLRRFPEVQDALRAAEAAG